jgi:hypothetical protein
MSGIVPTLGKKRGRTLRTDTGRELSHEELVYGLIKRTAVEVANAGTCACGGVILQPRKGRKVTLCLACKGIRNRKESRERKWHGQRIGKRGEFSTAHNIAQAHTKEVHRRKSAKRVAKKRDEVGMCRRCGEIPRVEGKTQCQGCLKQMTDKAMANYVPKKRACVYKCALCGTRGHSRRTCPTARKRGTST